MIIAVGFLLMAICGLLFEYHSARRPLTHRSVRWVPVSGRSASRSVERRLCRAWWPQDPGMPLTLNEWPR